jgi:tRNA G18 (ribose-2'-O)-methylase SpoU
MGIQRIIVAGRAVIDPEIARDATEVVTIETRRSLLPVLRKLRGDGFRIVALEQAARSQTLFDYAFRRESVLVVGHEREGLLDDVLAIADDVVEIPVYGRPLAYNVATAATMALYEYCRRFPSG